MHEHKKANPGGGSPVQLILIAPGEFAIGDEDGGFLFG